MLNPLIQNIDHCGGLCVVPCYLGVLYSNIRKIRLENHLEFRQSAARELRIMKRRAPESDAITS